MKVVLQGVVGSTAYGLATKNSDVDQLGIYIDPIDARIGLSLPRSDSFVQHNPDVTIHEVGKYCSLAAKANPTVLELMYCTEYARKSWLIDPIIDNRRMFLSESYVRNSYGGYAVQQRQRLTQRNHEDLPARMEKLGRHAIRLMLQGQELLTTGSLTLDISEHRDYIFDMGHKASHDTDAFLKEFGRQISKLNDTKSVLPEQPNRDMINELLLNIRWENHGSQR